MDDFLARRVKTIIRRGQFRDEDAFLRGAIEEMVRMYELRELDEKMGKFSRRMATRHPMSVSDAVLAARVEGRNVRLLRLSEVEEISD